MDLDLPLILFVLIVITGIGWLLDLALLAPTRKLGVNAVNLQFSTLGEQEKSAHPGYVAALEAARKEPAWAEYSKSFFPVLVVVFGLRSFLVEPFQIPSGSMIPTLLVGDYIAVNKFAYGIRLPIIKTKIIPIDDPKRGDVVVFFPPNETRYFIKRLVGLPGDTVQIINNVVYVNNQPASQQPIESLSAIVDAQAPCPSYIVANEQLSDKLHHIQRCNAPGYRGKEGTWQVPQGHYFMMGDNRDNSSDSRFWGFVPEQNIVGKAFAVWLHWGAFASLPNFSSAGLIQ